MKREDAIRLRKIIEQVMSGHSVDNKTAYEGRSLFPDTTDEFWDGHLITTGTRLRVGDELYAAANDLWATIENKPNNAPTLWEKLIYRDGYRVLNGPISASNPVNPGEKCWENDVLYECISTVVNTYRPSEYMPNWKRSE